MGMTYNVMRVTLMYITCVRMSTFKTFFRTKYLATLADFGKITLSKYDFPKNWCYRYILTFRSVVDNI